MHVTMRWILVSEIIHNKTTSSLDLTPFHPNKKVFKQKLMVCVLITYITE